MTKVEKIEALAKVLEERVTSLPEPVFKLIPQGDCLRKIAALGRDCRKHDYTPDQSIFALELIHLWAHFDEIEELSQRDWDRIRVKLIWRCGCNLALLSVAVSPSPKVIDWLRGSGQYDEMHGQFHVTVSNLGADLGMLKMYETYPEAFTTQAYGDEARDRWCVRWKDFHRQLTLEILS